MKSISLVTLTLLASLSACATTTRESVEAPAVPSPSLEQHAWLHQFVGEWTSEAEIAAEPGQPAQKLKGTESVRAVGGLWIVADVRGESPMGTMEAVLTIGYDPERKRFVGTWIDSMINHMWVYDGSLDGTGKILSLESEGPSFAGDGGLAKYKDVFEFKSPDHKVLTSSVRNADGTWTSFLTSNYRRTK